MDGTDYEHTHDAENIDMEESNGEEIEVSNILQQQNDEVQSHNFIVEQLESRLETGQVMASKDDAYLLYCSYAHAKGFSVRKGDQRYFSRSDELQMKVFLCACEGEKDEKRCNEKLPDYQKIATRTQCKAKLKIKRVRGGEFKVSKFVKDHNHEMLKTSQAHLSRSSRNISHAKSSTLEALVNAGIPVSTAVSYMENEAQGPANLGFIRKDAYNHLDRLKKHTKVEDGDASALIQYFISKSNKETFFYWNVQVDDDGRVMNFFYRDYRCLVDYEYFGDVLSVDTTYKTNKYNLICAPFTGVNHHKQNVMFGLAFMSDETESSFEWLFETFLDSMNGKHPEVVFTDQCQAMMNAVETKFPSAFSRLCQWHINQNAPSHFGSLNGDLMFKHMWNECMYNCESEVEFEHTWKYMVGKYKLGEHRWFNGMYKLRRKWANAFSNTKFSAGMSSTSISESTNAALKRQCRNTTSLYDFVLKFQKIQTGWRSKENDEDGNCLRGKPSIKVKNHPLLKQVAAVYTHTIYNKFEKELVDSLTIIFVEQPFVHDGRFIEFKVKSHDQNSRIRHVVFDKQTCDIKCSCHQFETLGILCKHSLKILNSMNVNVLPKAYIKARWMKDCSNRIVGEVHESGKRDHESEMVFVNKTMRSFYNLTLRCKAYDETRRLLTGAMEATNSQVDEIFKNLKVCDKNASKHLVVDEDGSGTNDQLIRNPRCAKTRGITNAQIVRHWDKGKGKRKADKSIAKGTKKIEQSSKVAAPTPSSQEINRQYPIQEGGSGDLGGQMNLFTYPFEHLFSSQEQSQKN